MALNQIIYPDDYENKNINTHTNTKIPSNGIYFHIASLRFSLTPVNNWHRNKSIIEINQGHFRLGFFFWGGSKRESEFQFIATQNKTMRRLKF